MKNDYFTDGLSSVLAALENLRASHEENCGETPDRPTRPEPEPSGLPRVQVSWFVGSQPVTVDTYSPHSEWHRWPVSVMGGEICILRTRAGGVTKVLVEISNNMGLALLNDLNVRIDGKEVFNYEGSWVLDPAQPWVKGFYVDSSGVIEQTPGLSAVDRTRYWADRAKHLFKPVPAGAPAKLRAELEALLDAPMIGPFQPGLPDDPGAAGGLDWGQSLYGHETWLCVEGFALMDLQMERLAQRCRVFHMDRNGEPRKRWFEEEYWSTWSPRSYKRNWDDAVEHWADYPKIDKLKTFDGQHAVRGWRAAWVLKDVDPFAKRYLGFWANRSALQWDHPQDNEENGLLRGIEAVIRRLVPGQGSESLGREGNWAALLSHAHDPDSALTLKFRVAFGKAAHPVTGEVMADPAPSKFAQHRKPGGRFDSDVPLMQSMEAAIAVSVMREIGLSELSVKLASQFHKTLGGKFKEFGGTFGNPRNWEDARLPYLEMVAGNFESEGGSVEAMLAIAATRGVTNSAQPLINCPRALWEGSV